MKLLNLIPVTDKTVVSEGSNAYIARHLRPDTEVISRQIEHGTPIIASELDEALCAPEVVRQVIAAEEEGFDGVFVNCFGEPGVAAARECVGIPVYGGFGPAMHVALGLGRTISILQPKAISLAHFTVARECLNSRVASIRSIGLSVFELGKRDALVRAVYDQALAAIKEDGADAIVLGCTAMVNVAEDAQAMLRAEGFDTCILEPAQCAMNLLEMTVAMGLSHSRITYEPAVYKDLAR